MKVKARRVTEELTDEVEIDRLNRSRGSWVWHEEEPWIVVSMQRLARGSCQVVMEQASVEEDSMVYKYKNKPLVFGRDGKVLETWMDEDYVTEQQEPDPFSSGDDAELAGA